MSNGRLRAAEPTLAPERCHARPPKPRRLDEPISVSLEELVPASNFYRHLEAQLDLSFVRAWVEDCYAERGRPGIDPAVFFKLQLIMFFEGIRSERQLIETANLHLAHRWYLGYALDESLPDHSSLTRIRQRLGVEVFQRFRDDRRPLPGSRPGLGTGALLRRNQGRGERRLRLARAPLLPRRQDARRRPLCRRAPPDETRLPSDLPAAIVRLPSEPNTNGPAPTGSASWRLLEERRLDPHRPSDRDYDG